MWLTFVDIADAAVEKLIRTCERILLFNHAYLHDVGPMLEI